MNGSLKTSWDLSEYYSGLDDEKFQKDWDFFVFLSENFIKNYSMKIPTFHTYDDLVRFYQDFEAVLEIYENLRYFLHYKNSLDIFDEEIIQKIDKIEKISENFLAHIAKIYKQIYISKNTDFIKNLQEFIDKNPTCKYHYTTCKLIDDMIFYFQFDENFFEEKYELEKNIKIFENDYQSMLSYYSHGRVSLDDFLDKSSNILYQLIVLRTRLLKYSSYQSVLDFSLSHYSINAAIVPILQNSIALYFSHFSRDKIYEENLVYDDFLELSTKIFSQAFPEGRNIFNKFLEAGCIDIFPSENKVKSAFTTISAGKKPYICINASGNFSDLETIFHEFGHAYQMYSSRHISLLEFLPSPFMTEFCASFSEQKLLQFYKKHWEYSSQYSALHKRIIGIISHSLDITGFEYACYEAYNSHEFFDATSFRDWLIKNEYYQSGFLSSVQVFTSPFYVLSYVFANIFASLVIHEEKSWEIFSKISSYGGSESVENIFSYAGIDIFDQKNYKNGIERIIFE